MTKPLAALAFALGAVLGLPGTAHAHVGWLYDTTETVLGGIDHGTRTNDGSYGVYVDHQGAWNQCGVAYYASTSTGGDWKQIVTVCSGEESARIDVNMRDKVVIFIVCRVGNLATCRQTFFGDT